MSMDKPSTCSWCDAETPDLKPFRVFYHYRGGPKGMKPDVWWISPCCVKEIKGYHDNWTLEPVEIEEDESQ